MPKPTLFSDLCCTSSNILINSTSSTFPLGSLTTTISLLVNLADGAYKWFVNLFDWAGNSQTSSNYTLNIDTTYSLIEFVDPTPYSAAGRDAATPPSRTAHCPHTGMSRGVAPRLVRPRGSPRSAGGRHCD